MARKRKVDELDHEQLKNLSFIQGVVLLLSKMSAGACLSQNLTVTREDGTEIVVEFKLKRITLADGTQVKLR